MRHQGCETAQAARRPRTWCPRKAIPAKCSAIGAASRSCRNFTEAPRYRRWLNFTSCSSSLQPTAARRVALSSRQMPGCWRASCEVLSPHEHILKRTGCERNAQGSPCHTGVTRNLPATSRLRRSNCSAPSPRSRRRPFRTLGSFVRSKKEESSARIRQLAVSPMRPASGRLSGSRRRRPTEGSRPGDRPTCQSADTKCGRFQAHEREAGCC
jgi:hypothetical protein